jgi:hypothetical protein
LWTSRDQFVLKATMGKMLNAGVGHVSARQAAEDFREIR